MKISVNWIKEYIDFELPPIDELVTKIGAQIGAVEEVVDVGAKYQGVVVAKVVSCEKHPGADKLSVCLVDDGGVVADVDRNEKGYVQVVCGAPNVREGLLVAWIPPKTIVPSTYDTSDPFTLEARELRGVVSNGMIASGKELAINEDHTGILEIDQDTQPGQPFAEVYKLNDYIIDIENKMFTHRPDCFGQLGVAREIAGVLRQKFTSPDWYLKPLQDVTERSSKTLPFEVKNDIPALTPRFIAVALADVTVQPSPIWLQSYLSRVGIRPINNIVDITNYVMALTAQPLHAYDYDKVKALDGNDVATLARRHPQEGERLTLLGGKEIEPRKEAILIASATKPIGLGGVMGGADTEVDENTKNIILECANFDMYSIRRTSMAHGLFTDAVTRFNKGQSPLQNRRVAMKAVQLFGELAGAQQASDVIDNVGLEKPDTRIDMQPNGEVVTGEAFINARLGTELTQQEVMKLLQNVEFGADIKNDMTIFDIPFWRTDIAVPEDVVEEIGRLYGFEKLSLELPHRTATPVQRNTLLEAKANIRNILASGGANEVSTYSFVHGDLLDKMGQDKDQAFQLSNALSPDLQYYRLSLAPSLLEKVHPNIKVGYDEFALFEIGKAHIIGTADRSEPDLPAEFNVASLIYAARTAKTGAAYYVARKYFMQLCAAYHVTKTVSLEPLTESDSTDAWVQQLIAPYEPQRSAVIRTDDGTIWGVVGEYKPSVRKALKLPEYTAGFEVGPFLFIKYATQTAAYTPLPKFPKVTQDVTLHVPANITHASVASFVDEFLQAHKPKQTHLTVTAKDIYQKTSEDETHVTFGISIAHYEKTMRDEEVTKLLDSLKTAAAETYNTTQD